MVSGPFYCLRLSCSRLAKGLVLSVFFALLSSLQVQLPAVAAPSPQGEDPCAQCAAGKRLFLDGQYEAAQPLLEAGFARLDDATCEPDAIASCALALGIVRRLTGDQIGALEAGQVALEILHDSGNHDLEVSALNHIGNVYSDQGRYIEAIETYRKAVTVCRKASDWAEEGRALNNIGTILLAQGNYVEALEAFWKVLDIARLWNDRSMEASAYNNIGSAYNAQGFRVAALDAYQKALSIFQDIQDRAEEGNTLNNIGSIYSDQGRYAQALESYAQALAIHQEFRYRVREGITLGNIGTVYNSLGDRARAIEMYRQALDIARETGNRAGEAALLNNMCRAYSALCDYQRAQLNCWQALSITREIGHRYGESVTLNNLGLIGYALSEYDQALLYYRRSLDLKSEIGDRDGEAATLSNIGQVYDALSDYDRALLYYRQSLNIQQEIGDRVGEAATLNNIGAVLRSLSNYDQALEHYQQSLSIVQEIGHQYGEAVALNNIGGIYSALSDYEQALLSFEHSLRIHREIGSRVEEGLALGNIGSVYEDQLHYSKAVLAYQQAIDVLESVRTVSGSEQGRASFIAQYDHLYTRTAALYHQGDQNDRAFFTSERGRARAFLDSLATGYVELSDSVANELLVRERNAWAFCLVAQDALTHAQALSVSDPDMVTDLQTQLANAKAAHNEALADIEAYGDQLVALVPGRSAVLDVPEVQSLLDDQTTMISYYVLNEQTLAFFLTRTSFETISLDVSQEDLVRRILDFHAMIPKRQPRITQPAAEDLYRLLFAPLSDAVTTTRLVVVPHGPLHYLPFAALTDPGTGQALLERYTLVILPSASTLPFIRANAVTPSQAGDRDRTGHPLVVGDPVAADLDPLPFAEKEAQAVAQLYGVQPLLGEAATEGTVREHATQASILHLAAHATYNPHNPLYSAILLASDGGNDGRLEVQEVYSLDLAHTDLVVLSACETQLGELSTGDELVGLTRAFFFAGAPSIVATLWSVDDEATALVMERFYTHLNEGMSKAGALRQAQLDVRTEYPDPYYWAGFVLSGDGGAASMNREFVPVPTAAATVAPLSQETPVPPSDLVSAEWPGWVWPTLGVVLVATISIGWLFLRQTHLADSQ